MRDAQISCQGRSAVRFDLALARATHDFGLEVAKSVTMGFFPLNLVADQHHRAGVGFASTSGGS